MGSVMCAIRTFVTRTMSSMAESRTTAKQRDTTLPDHVPEAVRAQRHIARDGCQIAFGSRGHIPLALHSQPSWLSPIFRLTAGNVASYAPMHLRTLLDRLIDQFGKIRLLVEMQDFHGWSDDPR